MRLIQPDWNGKRASRIGEDWSEVSLSREDFTAQPTGLIGQGTAMFVRLGPTTDGGRNVVLQNLAGARVHIPEDKLIEALIMLAHDQNEKIAGPADD